MNYAYPTVHIGILVRFLVWFFMELIFLFVQVVSIISIIWAKSRGHVWPNKYNWNTNSNYSIWTTEGIRCINVNYGITVKLSSFSTISEKIAQLSPFCKRQFWKIDNFFFGNCPIWCMRLYRHLCVEVRRCHTIIISFCFRCALRRDTHLLPSKNDISRNRCYVT